MAGAVFFLSCPLSAALAQSVESVVVVSARVPDPVGNAAFSVVNLDTQALQQTPELDSSLAQVPGLSLFRRDSSLTANPTTQGVSLREIAPSGAGRALVTLDGVPQNDPFGGWVIWSSLPPEDIESAEVVRGAGAGPYGAGALTGTIALSEAQADGLRVADASGGTYASERVATAGGAQLGPITFFGSASYESGSGFIPVLPYQRGPADSADSLVARNASLSASYSPASDLVIVARANVYDEMRDSGNIGGTSADSGVAGSLTIAHPQQGDNLGWRLQTWFRDTAFSQTSVSIALNRQTTTPSDDQYATPAMGWGANAALRGSLSWVNWEIGGDARFNQGASEELYSYVSGKYTSGRNSGGRNSVAGIYAEGASHIDDWLVTVGLRADSWNQTGGRVIQTSLATGATTLDQQYAARSGNEPTARLGVRRNLGDGFYFRSAGYKGFRPVTLNELYRPFRQGNNITEANANLTPEELYGAEVGGGYQSDNFTWDGDLFWNQLHRGVTNVTVGQGPATFPVVGLVPAGGFLIQRQNVGDVDARGFESDAHWSIDPKLRLNFGFEMTDARVDGGVADPQLTGLRPSQAPRWTITGGFLFTPLPSLSVESDVHYESNRFADDQNTLPLGTATIVDAKITYDLTHQLAIYGAAENLFNSNVASTESANFVTTYSTPRILRVGLSYTPL